MGRRCFPSFFPSNPKRYISLPMSFVVITLECHPAILSFSLGQNIIVPPNAQSCVAASTYNRRPMTARPGDVRNPQPAPYSLRRRHISASPAKLLRAKAPLGSRSAPQPSGNAPELCASPSPLRTSSVMIFYFIYISCVTSNANGTACLMMSSSCIGLISYDFFLCCKANESGSLLLLDAYIEERMDNGLANYLLRLDWSIDFRWVQ
jgi:hypothetical protein